MIFLQTGQEPGSKLGPKVESRPLGALAQPCQALCWAHSSVAGTLQGPSLLIEWAPCPVAFQLQSPMDHFLEPCSSLQKVG